MINTIKLPAHIGDDYSADIYVLANYRFPQFQVPYGKADYAK